MYKVLKLIILLIFTAVFLFGPSTTLAKEKAGGLKDRPAGWDKGKKTGWEGDRPPGLEKEIGEKIGKGAEADGKDKKDKDKVGNDGEEGAEESE